MDLLFWTLLGLVAVWLVVRALRRRDRRRAADALRMRLAPRPVAVAAGDSLGAALAALAPDAVALDVTAELCTPDGPLVYDREVAGTSEHQDALGRQAALGAHDAIPCVLSLDPDDPAGPDAIGVWCGGGRVGHLSEADAASIRTGIRRVEAETGHKAAVPGRLTRSGTRGPWGMRVCVAGIGGMAEDGRLMCAEPSEA